jgi:hypothetical protein
MRELLNMRICTVLFVAAAAMAWAEPPSLPEPYRSVVELSHAAPPEFAADALLRILEESGKIESGNSVSGKILDRDSKRRLLEDAFRLAEVATFPVRMRALPGIPQDTRSAFLSRAYGLQLDALSLESRAATDMLSLDVPRARELFLEIPPPALPAPSCDDALVSDLSNFYHALSEMVSRGFTDKERSKQEHVNFLLGFMARATSPLQFPPLADVIAAVNVTPTQRELLWSRFNGMLANAQPDGRSFSFLLADASRMPKELQAFLDKNSGAGCPDDAVPVRAKAGEQVSGQPQPARASSTPKLDLYWQSADAQRLFDDGLKLRLGSAGQPLSESDRATTEWRQRLADYLTELADWGPSQEKSEADYFHQKCQVFVNLIDLIPPGSDRDQALGAFVNFVGNSTLQRQSPVEWYLEATSLLERVGGARNGEPDKIRDAFERSGNPVLILSNELDRLLGGKTPEWVKPPGSS